MYMEKSEKKYLKVWFANKDAVRMMPISHEFAETCFISENEFRQDLEMTVSQLPDIKGFGEDIAERVLGGETVVNDKGGYIKAEVAENGYSIFASSDEEGEENVLIKRWLPYCENAQAISLKSNSFNYEFALSFNKEKDFSKAIENAIECSNAENETVKMFLKTFKKADTYGSITLPGDSGEFTYIDDVLWRGCCAGTEIFFDYLYIQTDI